MDDAIRESDPDLGWMRHALELAERGRFTVSPNPLVGCVLVRDGVMVGGGWHERAGGPHAEIVALADAGDQARGATAYVTLEPCAHTGRTGPCTDALVAAGVQRVVYALPDPNPLAAGGGERLRKAGLDVQGGVGQELAARQNEVFLHVLHTGRPFVTVKAALSVDGRLAAADGTSKWLTGEQARTQAHALRAEADAVIVGSGTVLADDPALTVRRYDFGGPQPLRVVLDGRGRTPVTSKVLDSAAPTLIAVSDQASAQATAALEAAGAEVVSLPSDRRGVGVQPRALLHTLARRGVCSVLVEGGAQVAAGFLREGHWDRLVVHVAAVLLGAEGQPLQLGEAVTTLAEAPRLRLDDVAKVGDDVVLTYRPLKSAQEA